MISENDLRNILRHRCEAAGSVAKWAAMHGLNQSYVQETVFGNYQSIGPKIYAALGYRKIIQFAPCNSENEGAKE
jgi:hypothetical protein